MPIQTTLVAVDGHFTPDWFRVASIKHDWRNVRQLCLVLLPLYPVTIYPAAEGTYRECLRVLSTQLMLLVELNVSSFHFGFSLDVTAFLQDGWLHFLQSLSAPPCAMRSVLALRCLATNCPDFKELDVRFESKGGVWLCAGCECEFARGSASPVFRNGLARLTLSNVHDSACLWFIDCCRPVSALRLSYCPSKLDQLDYERMSRALAHSMDPSCLILEHDLLPLDDAALLANLQRFADLQYLYLLLYQYVGESAFKDSVACIRRSLPQLKCLHIHYWFQTDTTVFRIVTWMRGTGGATGEDLFEGGPCLRSCSTATFIGLLKPPNRDFQPML
ncbi:hypothetical protein MTO96_028038 [Rhipicephalus appendiculatus]